MLDAYLLGGAVDGTGLVIAVHKQDVLRLEVCVRELVIVQKQHAVYQLVRDVPHLFQRVGLVVVVFLQWNGYLYNIILFSQTMFLIYNVTPDVCKY